MEIDDVIGDVDRAAGDAITDGCGRDEAEADAGKELNRGGESNKLKYCVDGML